jgi:hypothetical protein
MCTKKQQAVIAGAGKLFPKSMQVGSRYMHLHSCIHFTASFRE